jgi:CRISPR-associated protein
MSTFHHAYNGIPTRRSDAPFLRDGEPAPLDHLARDTYSGTLKLTIETKTPLITAWRDPDGRLVVPSASGKKEGALSDDDDAIIPATSLKGVLSAAYEAVTQSRFRVFDNDERQAQFRYTTDHPQRWQKNDIRRWKTGFLRVALGDEGHKWSIHLQQCALLPDSINAEVNFAVKETEVENLLKSLRESTPHLSQVDSFEAFKQELPNKTKNGSKKGTRKETKLIVSNIHNINICTSKSPKQATPQSIKCEGYVVRLTTVPESGFLTNEDRLMSTKYNEYIFYTDKGTPKAHPIQLDVNSAFVATILEAARIASNPKTNKGAHHTLINRAISHIKQNGKDQDLSKRLTPENIYEFLLDEAGHDPGIPVFARKRSNEEWEVAFSQLGRSATPGSLPPSRLAEIGNVTPAQSIEEASATDRLWGFVSQNSSDNTSPAFKGRIYLTNAFLQPQEGKKHLQHRQGSSGWVPSILAGPKPWTAQPYLRNTDGSGIFDTERSECFTNQHSLIRKTYPTHRFLLTNKRQSILKQITPARQLSSSETLIGSYVDTGAKFESTLRFEGLSAEELSVLLWLLDPEKIVPEHQRAAGELGFFHLGLGKPLGLGTVCIRAKVSTLISSKTLAGCYRDLKSVLNFDKSMRSETERNSLDAEIASIKKKLPPTISGQKSLAVKAFVRSAYGWKGDEDAEKDPVAYSPYTFHPKKRGISHVIRYFTEYEKTRIKDEEFDSKMLTLEEDEEDISPQCLDASKDESRPYSSGKGTVSSDDSATLAPRPSAPKPGPRTYSR